MNAPRLALVFLAWALVALYGYRAAIGVDASLKFERGVFLESIGYYRDAAPRLDVGATGGMRMRGLRMSGRSLTDRWEDQADDRGPLRADREKLEFAAQRFLESRCVAPGSGASFQGLAEVYDALEWIGREERSIAGTRPSGNPWLRVGRSGRIAIGMMRGASEVAPNWFLVHDWLAIKLWHYELEESARQAVRDAARVLPVFQRHNFAKKDDLPEWFVEEFAKASREALGQVQLFPQTGHLIDLGKLERRIGETDGAISAFQGALDRGGDELQRAEAGFNLGLTLIDAGRKGEGADWLERAGKHPRFRAAALRSLATLASEEGRPEEALEYLQSLRWEQPESLWPCLEYARVASRLEDWPKVVEALTWAKMTHPDDVQPYEALTEAYLGMRDLTSARITVDELATLEEAESSVARLRRQIAAHERDGQAR